MSNKPDDTAAEDWRKAVTQQYRTSEVSNIAQVLASLDASTSAASKMMLASRFEDTCFKTASSLAEYRKMIVKRLKNLQKNYVPPTQASSPPPPVPAEAPAPEVSFKTSSESLQAAQQLQVLLQKTFGESIACISKYAKAAVQKALSQYGRDRAFQLQQHVNNVLQWAVDIAIFPDDGKTLAITDILPTSTQETSTIHTTTTPMKIPIRSKVPWLLAFSSGDSTGNNAAFLYLQQVQKHLTHRISNIKSHVLKHSNFDLFMEETLLGVEEKMAQKINAGENEVGRGLYHFALQDATLKSMVGDMDKLEEIQKWMDKASAVVPIPRSKAEEREAGKRYLKKMEACSNLYMLYGSLNVKENGGIDTPRLENRTFLKRAYNIFIESGEALTKLCTPEKPCSKNHGVGETEHISLEDAWNKIMVYDGKEKKKNSAENNSNAIQVDEILEAVDVDVVVDTSFTRQKRPKMEDQSALQTTSSLRSYPAIIRAKVLAKPGRRILPPFIHALKQKGAELERPEDGNGIARIKMTFGQAFDMYIYFSPLLVAIRATKPDSSSRTSSSLSTALTTVPPITRGLSTISSFKVMGVRGDYATVGHLVAKQLEFASARATHVLRQCFSEEFHKMSKLSDNDVEILEGSAMIKFLQIARMTYLNQKENTL